MIALAFTSTGCGGGGNRAARRPATPQQRAVLTEGFSALDAQQYNDAIAKADQFLAGVPHGPESAEALYLRGRGLEGKNAAGVTPDEAKANLQAAREAYIRALEQSPREPLNAYVRTSLGNVAYFQDDYATAVSQLTSAYDALGTDAPDLKAWALYRVGLSQQRLGRFPQADKTFQAVQENFPNSLPAQRAREHQGARAFFVQLATFASAATADQAVLNLRRQGVAAARETDPQGHAVLRAGPIASYGQAQFLKQRFAEQYPDAVVVP
ncbi:MAG TPA: tetratricopeptide repeat protein [Tepidisphaeraceae bacterium]|nr:tetratricopeptide repeat protein [Tepidisphaeraceae bacterium]